MALLLTDSNTIFIHVPRTGGHFVETAIRHFQIPHRIPEPIENVCPRHGLTHHFGQFDCSFCFIRHPVSWIESYWKLHRTKRLDFLPDRWYPHRIFGETVPDQFPDFVHHVLQQPGCISEFLLQFTNCCTDVLYYEHLEIELTTFLHELGYHHVSTREMSGICLQNVSRPADTPWPDDLKDRFLKSEAAFIERYYPNGLTPSKYRPIADE